MANEYADNIRRIARGDRRRGGLTPQGERDAIESGSVPLLTNAQIAELNNEQQTPSSSAPENEDKDPEDEEQQDNIDPNDPNSFYRGAQSSTGSQTDTGTYDISDVIDQTGNVPGSATESDGTQLSGALRELTGLKDCESGTSFNLHLDGQFIPPEGWDDPETPPPIDGWEEGYYWETTSHDFTYSIDDDDCINGSASYPSRMFFSKSPATAYIDHIANEHFDAVKCPGFLFWSIEYKQDTETLYQVDVVGESAIFSITSRTRFYAWRRDCAQYFDATYCPTEPPTEEQWTKDGTYDLAIKDGQLQTSEFDADKPRDEALGTKPFCFGEDRTGEARVTADGGLMVYETGAEGAPIGAATVYDSAGDFRAAGDATETFINQYLPK